MQIMALIKSLIDLPGAIRDLGVMIQGALAKIQEAREEDWLRKGQQLEREILLLKSDKERAEYVKKLQDLRNNTPG
jgi:hypothetical protein